MMHLIRNRIAASRIFAIGVLLAALMIAARPAYAETTFKVTNTNDSGTGSLKQAIIDANNTAGADTINFAIPGGGVHTIAPTSELPAITGYVTIDGYSQPGSKPNTLAAGNDAVVNVELSGANAAGNYGLFVIGPNTTIKGLAVNRWKGAGIVLIGGGAVGNRVQGNFIGTTPSGDQPAGNVMYGVYVNDSSGNTIGGATPAARNVVSASGGAGVYVEGAGSTGNRISGNYIGTDDTGTKALENNDTGVYVDGMNNTVGGTSAGDRNVISANDDAGVTIYGAGATGNKVLGNYIGTDKSGTKALGNADQGVFIGFAPDNTVGGTSAGERNVISANGDTGVLIAGTGARGNKVLGNYIGADKGGAAPLGNKDSGVSISLAPSNTIGGTTAGARNVISSNAYDGVVVNGDSATGNRILSNSIFDNGEQGIDLGANGPTANDPGDADTGANYLQNFPVLSSARKNAAGTTTVKGTLDSTPNSTFRLQFFSNPKGTDEGKTLLGSGTVATDGSGKASFTFSTKKQVRLDQNITATATGPGGNTSEFSAPKTVVAS